MSDPPSNQPDPRGEGTATITRSSFLSNRALLQGGAVAFFKRGCGPKLLPGRCTGVIKGSTFFNNSLLTYDMYLAEGFQGRADSTHRRRRYTGGRYGGSVSLGKASATLSESTFLHSSVPNGDEYGGRTSSTNGIDTQGVGNGGAFAVALDTGELLKSASAVNGGTVGVLKCFFGSNDCSGSGAAIYALDKWNDGSFATGAGVPSGSRSMASLRNSLDMTINGTSFVANVAGEAGGAMQFGPTRGTVVSTSFLSNSAEGNAGGGAFYTRGGRVAVDFCFFRFNTAGNGGGGAVHIGEARPMCNLPKIGSAWQQCKDKSDVQSLGVTGSTFVQNAVYLYASASRRRRGKAPLTEKGNSGTDWLGGGAIAIWAGYSWATVTTSMFRSNAANQGGAVIVGNKLGFSGGDQIDTGLGTLVTCVFERNAAARGGGISLLGHGPVVHSKFEGNVLLQNWQVETSPSERRRRRQYAMSTLSSAGTDIYVRSGVRASLLNCTFASGGSIEAAAGSTLILGSPSLDGSATWQTTGSTVIKGCPAGRAGAISVVTDASNSNPLGTGAFPSTYCLECKQGQAATAGALTCTRCPAGRFAEFDGASSCRECPQGFLANKVAASECAMCKQSLKEMGGAAVMPGSVACTPCAPGRAPNLDPGGGSSNCVACSPGFFSQGGEEVVTAWDWTPVNKDNKDVWPSGEFLTKNAFGDAKYLRCQDCPAGSYAAFDSEAACTACPAGFFSKRQAVECTACPMGWFWKTGAEKGSYQFGQQELPNAKPYSEELFRADTVDDGVCGDWGGRTGGPCPEDRGCQACPVGRFGNAIAATTDSGCIGCDDTGIDCSGGNLNIRAGFFRPASVYDPVTGVPLRECNDRTGNLAYTTDGKPKPECDNPTRATYKAEKCKSSSGAACVGGIFVARGNGTANTNDTQGCSKGSGGTLCDVCDAPQWFRNMSSGEREKCEVDATVDTTGQEFVLGVLMLAIVIILLVRQLMGTDPEGASRKLGDDKTKKKKKTGKGGDGGGDDDDDEAPDSVSDYLTGRLDEHKKEATKALKAKVKAKMKKKKKKDGEDEATEDADGEVKVEGKTTEGKTKEKLVEKETKMAKAALKKKGKQLAKEAKADVMTAIEGDVRGDGSPADRSKPQQFSVKDVKAFVKGEDTSEIGAEATEPETVDDAGGDDSSGGLLAQLKAEVAANKAALLEAKESAKAAMMSEWEETVNDFKLMISFVQVVSLVGLSYDIPWPAAFSGFQSGLLWPTEILDASVILRPILSLISLIAAPFKALHCKQAGSNFATKFYVHVSILPLAVLAILTAYLIVRVLRVSPKMRRRFTVTQAADRGFGLFNTVVFLLYPGLGLRVVRTFKCVNLYGTTYLEADMSITCGSPVHQSLVGLAVLNFIFIIIGVPLAYFLFIRNQQKKLVRDENGDVVMRTYVHDGIETRKPKTQLKDPAFVRRWGQIFKAYDEDYAWWDSVELLKKFVLTGGMVLVPGDSITSLFLATLVALFYLCAIIDVAPLKDSKDPKAKVTPDKVLQATNLQIVLVMLAGIMLKARRPIPGSLEASVFDGLLTFTQAVIMVIGLGTVFTAFQKQSKKLNKLPCFKKKKGKGAKNKVGAAKVKTGDDADVVAIEIDGGPPSSSIKHAAIHPTEGAKRPSLAAVEN